MASFSLVAPRRALVTGGSSNVGAGTVAGGAAHLDSTIENNHHNIPREYFNQRGVGSSGGDDGNNNNGNGGD